MSVAFSKPGHGKLMRLGAGMVVGAFMLAVSAALPPARPQLSNLVPFAAGDIEAARFIDDSPPAGVPAGAAQPSPAAIAAAKEILAMKHASNQYSQAVPSIVNHTKDQLLAAHPVNYEQYLDEVAVNVKKEFAGREQEVGEGLATVYANIFTEQELKDLVTFYKSSLGQKLLAGEPRAIEAGEAYMSQWGQRFAQTVMTQFQIEMHKRGKDL
jgi:uncharacterized protein